MQVECNMSNPTGKGGFKKGKSGNPNGRMKKEKQDEYQSILYSVCTPTRWREIVEKLVAQSISGNDKARKLLFDHTLGLPAQKLEHTGEDGKDIKIIVTYGQPIPIPDDDS
jgi:hypothetical protein